MVRLDKDAGDLGVVAKTQPVATEDEERAYQVSSALRLNFNPWGGFSAALGQAERNRRELSAEDVELLWLFSEPRSVAQALPLATESQESGERRQELVERLHSFVTAGYLLEAAHTDCDLERFHVFRAIADEWIRAPRGAFPLSSPLPHQRPGIYYPGLTAREFHDPLQFEWLTDLDWKGFRREALGLAARREGYKALHKGFTGQGAWAGAYLWVHGNRIHDIADRCPTLCRFLETTPGSTSYGTAFLSVLAPGSHVTPHCGSTNTKLRIQLPIIVPEQCHLRVGNRQMPVERQAPIVFDDSFLHSAWNHGATARIVLVCDFFHPDLTPPEIEYLLEITPKLDPSTRYTDPLSGERFPEWLEAEALEGVG